MDWDSKEIKLLKEINSKLERLILIMSVKDDLVTAVNNLSAAVTAAVAKINTGGVGSVLDADVEAAVTSLNQATAQLEAALNPPTPIPAAPATQTQPSINPLALG